MRHLPICALFLLFLTPITVFGAKAPEIVEVIPDYNGEWLTIMGNELSDGETAPTVTLGGFSLTISYFDANQIDVDADLSALVPGDYLLTVNNNVKYSKTAEALLTLGAVGPQGPMGEKGDTGDTGDAGPQGLSGISGYEVVHTNVLEGIAIAVCPEGKRVLGGGCSGGDDPTRYSEPLGDGLSWGCVFGDDGWFSLSGDGRAWAVCAIVE